MEGETGSMVFIGHGRSQDWRELKEFLVDRLDLRWEEFNRESVAGRSTKERLEEMLNNVNFAFIVMTAEDEHPGGTLHARANVIHEAGLFQGRLGFERAIILFEEGCEEFSNIHGLTQIRYPKGKIATCFEEIRKVLEREGILTENHSSQPHRGGRTRANRASDINKRVIALAIQSALSKIEYWRGQNVANLAAIYQLPSTLDLVPDHSSTAVLEAGRISQEASAELSNAFESLKRAQQQLEVMRDAKMTSPQLYQQRAQSFSQYLAEAELEIQSARVRLQQNGSD